MTTRLKLILMCACLAWLFNGALHSAESPKVIELWVGTAPGDKGDIGEEHDTTKPTDNQVAGKPVVRLGNVSKPTLTLYRPAPDKDTGVAVMVCPGGGYSILAMDLEGTEICQWLNSLGITGALLKYRVPKRSGLEKHVSALQDAQRGLGLLRHQSRDYGIDPKRIGVIGFSAGGHLAAALSNSYDHRTYPAVDEADAASSRPDFTLLVYPAYLTVKEEKDKIAPELNITSNTPPTFIAMTANDPVRVETGLFYAAALHTAAVPFELHVYPVGGHGYGLRLAQDLVTTWPRRAAEWMRSQGWLSRDTGER
jgi:acetyl esterase/lipase